MKLDELKKKIQEANPEIMELKRNCEVIYKIGKRSPVRTIVILRNNQFSL